jgi:protein SCO1/2
MKRLIRMGALSCGLAALAVSPSLAAEPAAISALDAKQAIAYSQAAVGRTVGDFQLTNRNNKQVSLAQFRGRPLVINLIYTACSDFCPTLVQTLYGAVEAGQEVFGSDAFTVVSVGFDARGDTPSRMRAFARTQGVDLPNWYFLSGSEADVRALAKNLGFIYFPSARGFDHLAQVSIVDSDGRVSQQIYGTDFGSPALVEPMRSLFSARPVRFVDPGELIDRIKLFCTYYDPAKSRYTVDYSIFISLLVGAMSLLGLAAILVRAVLQQRGRRATQGSPADLSDNQGRT